jgi:hypothetical protein
MYELLLSQTAIAIRQQNFFWHPSTFKEKMPFRNNGGVI